VWVHQVRDRLHQEGKRGSLAMGGYRKSRIAEMEATLRGWIKARADMTLGEMCERLAAEQGIAIKIPALWHQLNKWGLTFKKNPARQRAVTRRRAGSARRVDKKPTQDGCDEAGVSG
jgi:transposase